MPCYTCRVVHTVLRMPCCTCRVIHAVLHMPCCACHTTHDACHVLHPLRAPGEDGPPPGTVLEQLGKVTKRELSVEFVGQDEVRQRWKDVGKLRTSRLNEKHVSYVVRTFGGAGTHVVAGVVAQYLK